LVLSVTSLLQQALRLLVCLPLLISVPSQARDNSVGLGVGIAPDYEGAKKYRLIPFAAFYYEADWGSITANGPGLEVDLVKSRKLDAGPILRYNFGRKGSISDVAVRQLPRVSDTIEAGAFIGSGLPLSVLGSEDPTILTARISAVTDTGSGHDGTVADVSLGLVRPVSDRVTAIASVSATYASRNYMTSFFGVSPTGAALSGLPAYAPGAGFKDIGATIVVDTKISNRWSVSVVSSYSRLVGKAADSPVVDLRGTPNQAFGGFTLNYLF
jgi:MipA family protein